MARSRSQGIVVALLFGTLALIVYGSLYPFDLAPNAYTHSITGAVLDLSWARAGRGDLVANVLLYAPLGFCLLLFLYDRVRHGAALAVTIALGITLSFCVEVTQVFIAQRVPSWWDVVLNGAGTIIGAAAGVTWNELGGRMRTAHEGRGRTDRSGVVVIALWLAWRFAPFEPHFSLGKLKAAFAPLADPYFSTSGTLRYWIWWTLLAQIVFALTTAQRSIEALLALIAVVLASSLVIVGHVFVASELLALMLLLPTLFLFDRLTSSPRRIILFGAFAALFVHDSFAPFRLPDAGGGFDVWPFMGWIDAHFPIDWEWLMRRACYFAALVWVLKETGVPLRAVSILVPLVALCIEVTHFWFFGQHASITDPVLALIVGSALRFLERGNRSGSVTLPHAHSR